MMRTLGLVGLVACLVACGPDLRDGIDADTTYVVRHPALVELVAECLAEYQPALSHQLSVQDGGRAPRDGGHIAVGVWQTLAPESETPVAGGYLAHGRVIIITQETLDGDPDYLRATVCHEIGHSLGLVHSDCDGAGVMAPEGATSTPSECELDLLRAKY